MYKVLLACLVTLLCVSAEAQRDYPSQREARSQRNFQVCVHNNTRGQRVSRRAMRNIQEQCRRRVAGQEERRVERLRPRYVPERY